MGDGLGDRRSAEIQPFRWAAHVADECMEPVLVIHVPAIATTPGQRPEQPAEHGDRGWPDGSRLARADSRGNLFHALAGTARRGDGHKQRADHVAQVTLARRIAARYWHGYHDDVERLAVGGQHPAQSAGYGDEDRIVDCCAKRVLGRAHLRDIDANHCQPPPGSGPLDQRTGGRPWRMEPAARAGCAAQQAP